jgi:Holliday junction resolvasome RuvABC DNA-binding subunit
MAKTNSEQILIQVNDEVIELTGLDKHNFIAEREANKEVTALVEAEAQTKKQARLSALQKLGLTEEEINAIL